MSLTNAVNPKLNDLAIANFRNYLKIPSVQPDVNYDECILFLKTIAESIELPVHVYEYFPKKPILIITWIGKRPDLPSILLNSHMDVVPVYEENWTHDPFGAEMDEDENIYARGSQDMKCVGIQYLEAIRRLKGNGIVLDRTLHVSFVPDEEIGGFEGMKAFVQSEDFINLNVGFALDEGYSCPEDEYYYFYAERSACQMVIHCPGTTMHGAILAGNTAGQKVTYVMNKLNEYRERNLQKLQANSDLSLGDVTTVNVTILKGGVHTNIVPPEFSIVVDCRVEVTIPMEEFEETVNKWCKEAGEGVWIEFVQKGEHTPTTTVDETNHYWTSFMKAAEKLNIKLKRLVMPGGTDIRYVREAGIPAFGFSPMNQTPILVHGNDEFLNAKVFLRGIDIYYVLLPELGNTK